MGEPVQASSARELASFQDRHDLSLAPGTGSHTMRRALHVLSQVAPKSPSTHGLGGSCVGGGAGVGCSGGKIGLMQEHSGRRFT